MPDRNDATPSSAQDEAAMAEECVHTGAPLDGRLSSGSKWYQTWTSQARRLGTGGQLPRLKDKTKN